MFWGSNKCQDCGTKVKPEWKFCTNCGTILKADTDIFKDAEKEFHNIEKAFNVKIPKFMLKPPANAKGVSITITSDGMSPPKIEVKSPHKMHFHKHEHRPVKAPNPVRISKSTEEPQTKIERVQNKQVIKLNLPDVRSLSDIEIQRLPQSIEVRAFAGDKAYFKLIPIPSNASVNEEFKDGVLRLEVVK